MAGILMGPVGGKGNRIIIGGLDALVISPN